MSHNFSLREIKLVENKIGEPKIAIVFPINGATGLDKIINVSGGVSGNIPDNTKILIGHRESSESSVKIHADRVAAILSDNTFNAGQIYLGSDMQGAGRMFEIYALIVTDETVNKLALKDSDNPLGYMPPSLAKTAIMVTRGFGK